MTNKEILNRRRRVNEIGSKVETYCPSEDVFTNKPQAEARLKELQEGRK